MDTRHRVRMLLSKHFVTPIQRSLVHRLSLIVAPLLSRIPAGVVENEPYNSVGLNTLWGAVLFLILA